MNPKGGPGAASTVAVVLCGIMLVFPAWPADTGAIRVGIYHADGSPMEDALITIHSAGDGPIIRQGRTCEDGLVRFDDLAPARYEVRAAKTGYATITIPDVVVRSGRSLSVPMTLRFEHQWVEALRVCTGPCPEPPPRSVQVEVRERDGGPMAGAQVTLLARRDGPVLREGQTGDDGLVTFEELKRARYAIRVAKDGFVSLVIPEIPVDSTPHQHPVLFSLRRTGTPLPCGPMAVEATP